MIHMYNVAEYIKDNFSDVWKRAEKELEVPSAERKGKWRISNLSKDKILRYCSECGWGINLNDNRKYDYCPCCGARMEGEEE